VLQTNVLNALQLSQMRRQRVRSIVEDAQGNIWVGIYGDGILSFNPRTYEHRFFSYIPAIRHGLSGDAVRKLYFDSNGLLWIGTEGYGVNIWNPVSNAFGHFTHHTNDNNSLSNNVIWTIETDKEQNIWVGTDKGLNRINADHKTVTRYLTSDKSRPSLSSDLIYNLAIDEQEKTLWIATDRGLNRMDMLTGEVEIIRHDPQQPNSLIDDLIYDVELDNYGQLWLATNGGLDRMDLKSRQIYHYKYHQDNPNSLTKNTTVSKLFIDSQNNLWVGTDNGINRYNRKDDNFDRFLYTQGAPYNADSNFISAIAEVKRGIIWVGYGGNGISTVDFNNDLSNNKTNPKIGKVGINDGLPTNIIFGIIPDHFGRAWISTMNGLMLFDMNNNHHRVFGAKEGLLGSEFNDGAYAVAPDGSLFFGTTNGLAVIKPEQIGTPSPSKQLFFTQATIYQGKTHTKRPLIESSVLKIDYNAYALKLQFSDLNYYNAHQTNFAYQFTNLSGDWIDIGHDNAITLNNLAIGHHSLQLRSRNGGEWGDVKELTIIVSAPWWRTYSAYSMYLLITLIIGYLWFNSRQLRSKEKQQMHRQLKLFAEAFKNTTEGVMIMHRSRTIVAVNNAFTTITGYTEKEAIDSGTNLINSKKHSVDFYEHIWKTLEEEEQWQGEIWQNNKSGVDIAVEMTVSSVTNEAQEVSHFVAVFSDITERLSAEQELRKLAKFDSLTGLPNRTLLQDRLEHAISHGHRDNHKLAVLFLDLDHFKQVNDSLGHDIGDLLLIGVAERINKVLREDDTFARLGGDEFVIIVEDFQELNKLVHVGNRIIEQLAKPFSLVDYEVTTSTSIGITIYPDDGETSQILLKNADTAMYHAKAEGRNNFQFYTQSMNVQAFARLSIESELRHAIDHDEFVLYYQPRVHSGNGSVVSLEALIRWNHPDKGLVFPGYFIHIAEESGLIVPMSEWVIRAACVQLKQWDKSGFTDLCVSVNLSPRLFSHYDLVNFIEETLMFYQVPAQRLELEITESMLMDDVERTIADLHRLNDLGCHISVDDFGTGYSSLSYLHRFPVHTLKIDRSFISAIHEHEKGKALVDIIINLAKNLELDLVAEGVETKAQFAFLQSHVDMQIQGYYFSKPVDPEFIIPMLISGFDVKSA
jgi:diguanylate cyclase (GGDEF)-like protein/PAS domain S-box-containing protein